MTDFLPTGAGRIGSLQRWTAPATSKYRITLAGAAGSAGDNPFGRAGRGAVISGDFELNEGDTFDILVGQAGQAHSNKVVAGGGGTFFVTVPPEEPKPVVYVYREGLREHDLNIIDVLIRTCNAPVIVISNSEMSSFSSAAGDWSQYHLLCIGYPPGEGSTYSGVNGPYDSMQCPVISFCRHTTRNYMGISAGNSNGTTSVNKLVRHAVPPGAQHWAVETEIDFSTNAGNSQILYDGTSGEPVYTINTTTDRYAIVYDEVNGFPRIHFGIFRMDVGGELLQNMLRDMVGVQTPVYTPVIVAGGGGASGVGDTPYYEAYERADASLTEAGKDGIAQSSSSRFGVGGTDGNGGHYDGVDRAHGGGGFYGFGYTPNPDNEYSGFAYYAGGYGGRSYSSSEGGYGGGGGVNISTSWGACGGGGGYSGGGGAYATEAATEAAGGGGGSLNTGSNQQHIGWNEGEGWAKIEQLHTVGNRARSAAGEPVDEVVVRTWATKEFVVNSIPNEHGDWTADLLEGIYEIHYYHDGSQPMIHGPYAIE